MKIKFLFASFFIVLIFTSCSHSKNDEAIVDPGNSIPTTYLPIASANYWKYKVSSQGTDTNDILTVGSDATINAIVYKKMIGTADPSGVATGFYSTTLNNNNLRIDGSSLKLTGSINYQLPVLTTPITINLSDFPIFKQNATTGEILGSISGSTSQTVNSLPLTFDYTLRSEGGENLSTFTSDGVIYNNIKKSKLILNVKITTTQIISGVPNPITVVLMDAQDVATSTLHYANNRGMVYNNTLINYNINPSVASFLPAGFPLIGNGSQDEYLTSSHVN